VSTITAPFHRPHHPPGGRTQHRPVAVPGSAGRAHLRLVPPPARPAPLRLTRRGRAVLRIAVVLVLLLTVAALVLGLGRVARARPEPGPGVAVRYHVVLPGETLWRIAAVELPGVDRREAVARIIELNALPGAGVSAGQRLAVPAG